MCTININLCFYCDKIKSLFTSDFKHKDTIIFYLGNHSSYVRKYDLMKKYYLLAIEKGNTTAINYLGIYYDINYNYNLMKKYYLMYYKYKHYICSIKTIYYNYKYNNYNFL